MAACSVEVITGPDSNPEAVTVSDSERELIATELPEPAEEMCPEVSPHPIAEDIAATFDVSYQQVEDWFCSGVPFDEMLLALQTQKIVEVDVEWLFDQRLQGKTWDEIWAELGIPGL